MGYSRKLTKALAGWSVAVGLLTSCGCMSMLHPVQPVPETFAEPCKSLPRGCYDHVYIFLANGLDPVDYSDLTGLRRYLHHLGFTKTYYGQLYHRWYFEKEMRRIHRDDPDARFVLIGFSFGANTVRDMCHAVKKDGINIDLLVYLGGNTLSNCPGDKPDNAAHIINILAVGWIWNGDHLDGADNINLDNVWHFGSPTHPTTLRKLVEELARVAASVTFSELLNDPPPPGTEEPPPPRPGQPMPAVSRDQWDFLKPSQDLHVADEPAAKPAPAAQTVAKQTDPVAPAAQPTSK